MSKQEKIFRITIRGQYHSLNDVSGSPTLKSYEETFDLPSQEGALSTICKHLLAPRLRRIHPDFVRFRTHEKIKTELLNYKPNTDVLQMSVEDMSILELCDFCILKQLEIDPYVHASKDIFNIRDMVQKAYNNKRQAVKDALAKGDLSAQKELETLQRLNNVDTSSDPAFIISENERNVKAPVPLTVSAGSLAGFIEPLDEKLPPVEKDGPLE